MLFNLGPKCYGYSGSIDFMGSDKPHSYRCQSIRKKPLEITFGEVSIFDDVMDVVKNKMSN